MLSVSIDLIKAEVKLQTSEQYSHSKELQKALTVKLCLFSEFPCYKMINPEIVPSFFTLLLQFYSDSAIHLQFLGYV